MVDTGVAAIAWVALCVERITLVVQPGSRRQSADSRCIGTVAVVVTAADQLPAVAAMLNRGWWCGEVWRRISS